MNEIPTGVSVIIAAAIVGASIIIAFVLFAVLFQAL